MSDWCAYCSSEYSKVYHSGICPKIKSIEHHPNGTVKKVEFHETVPSHPADAVGYPDKGNVLDMSTVWADKQ